MSASAPPKLSEVREDEEEVASESTNEQEETVEAGEYYSALDPNEEITATPEQIKESMPDFENLDELKEFIKDIDTPTLEYLARGLRAEWTPTYNQAIHRMRVAQALHRYFFPELFKPKGDKKKKAKYGDLSTDRLFELVEEHNLRVNRSGNEPIDRMRAIMALKTVGVLES